MAGVKNRLMRAVFLLAALALKVEAAPFEKTISFTQPDGTQIELWGKGDDFQAVFEHQGYTVVFDTVRKTYTYAKLSPDGTELLPTRLDVGAADPAASGLTKHVRITAAAAKAAAAKRFEQWDAGMGVSQRWSDLKLRSRLAKEVALDGPSILSPPEFTTTGTKVGLCLLIDFDDDPATIPQAEIVDFCNGEAYTGNGNNGSVMKYFRDVSNNQLIYTNIVTAYIRIPNSLHPKSYYNDTSKGAGEQANLLIKDALDILKAQENYETEILPLFENLTVDGGNFVTACNVFYAGGNGGVWANGLWPHSWGLYAVGPQELAPDGLSVLRYQITNIGSSLKIGTFCHENGHMLCGYPDLYDYDYDSVGGAGNFCLMGYGGGDDRNPVQVCAYLKYASGWATTVEVTKRDALLASVSSALGSDDFNKFYRFEKPGTPTEYYLFENRNQSGRDANVPSSGVAIWHIDEQGDRDNQSLLFNNAHDNYECTLMQADNLWHFQSYANAGDARDLFYEGNPASGYMNRFSDTSSPSARWWDGTKSFIDVDKISASGPVMTFMFETPPPVIVSPDVLPHGRVGTAYTYLFAATNGSSPLVWEKISGEFPTGLALSASGVLSGIPELEETAVFDVMVTGSNGLSDTNRFTLSILPAFRAPYFENFEAAAGAIADGWVQAYVSNAIPWDFVNGNGATVRNPATAYSGQYNARFKIGSVGLKGSATKLVSPLVLFDEPTSAAQLRFRHYMAKDSLFQDELKVYCKTDIEAPWQLIQTYNSSVNVWTKRQITLPGPSASYYVAFEGVGKFGFGVHVDDVEILDPTLPLAFMSPSLLPEAEMRQPYSYAFSAEGGVPEYVFELVGGSLPDGLSISNGVISGTATTAGVRTFTVQITDAENTTVEQEFSIETLLPQVTLFAEDFEHGGAMPLDWSQAYDQGTYSWRAVDGGGNGDTFNLPDRAHGGYYNAVLFASSYSNNVTRLISPAINLGAAPADLRLTFWQGMVELIGQQDELRVFYRSSAGGAWNLLATYTNNVAEWTRRVLPLPEPSSTYYLAFEGTARFGNGVCIDDVRVTDASVAPIIMTVSPLPEGIVGTPYTASLTAFGGIPSYAWEQVSGGLPAGLSLSPDGVLSGVPTTAGTAAFGVRVVDGEGNSSTNQFTLKITNIQRLPYVQTFETSRQLPLGWSQENVTTPSINWVIRNGSTIGSPGIPAAAHSGTNNALFSTLSGAYVSRLITPLLNLGDGSQTAQLSFWLCLAKKTNQDELKVYYKTNAEETVWTQLAHFNRSITAWTNIVLDLPSPSPNYVIAFEGYARGGYGVCVDDVEITGSGTAYDAWKAAHFSLLQLADELVSGDEADPDNDLIPNALEFAMGFDPLTPDTEGLPFGFLSSAGYLTFSFRMDKDAVDAGVVYVVEACTDLIMQDWTTNNVSELFPRADSNEWYQAVFRHDEPASVAPRRFMRMKIYMP